MGVLRLANLKGLDPETRRTIRTILRKAQEENDDARDFPLDPLTCESKWHNVRTTLDGITFHSAHEANRYAELVIEQRTGEIKDLELQKTFRLDVNGIHICNYRADFVYERSEVRVVEDAKGKATDVYKIKRRLMRAIHGINIVEV